MRNLARSCSAALAAALMTVCTSAMAADADYANQGGGGGFYGNLHGSLGLDFPGSGTFRAQPFLNFGGKAAYEGEIGELGTQFDFDYWTADSAWSLPTITPQSSYSSTIDTAAHISYLVDQDRKLGLFAGYSVLDSYSHTPGAPITQFGTTSGLLGFGAEGLWSVNDTTSVQARAAALTRILALQTVDVGLGPVRTGGTQFNLSDVGAMAALGVNHQFTPNWSAHGDLGVVDMSYGSTGSSELAYGASLGAQYTMDSMPLSIGAEAGVTGDQVGGTWNQNYLVGTKLIYSFGGPSQGVQGKLFRSGMLGFLY